MRTALRQCSLAAACALAGVLSLGAASSTADDCAWTQQKNGTETAVCKDGVGRSYCLTCSYSPRICQRTACAN
jgi:hypothetical protein